MAIFGPKKGGFDPPGRGAPPGSPGKRDSRRRQTVLLVNVLNDASYLVVLILLFLLPAGNILYGLARLTGVLLARCRQLGKNPNFRGPCDRLSHRAKNRRFFPNGGETPTTTP